MADLPSQANRMNDIEITANAAATESVFRRIGSNLNFLLDFLGVSNGSTSASGILSDFTSALSTVEGHTIALQANINAGLGTQSVGTYTPQKFVDRVFWMRRANSSTFASGGNPNDPIVLMKRIDGGSTVQWNAARNTPASIGTTTVDDNSFSNFGTRGANIERGLNSIGEFFDSAGGLRDSTDPRLRWFDGGLGVIGYESQMRAAEWHRLGVLDYREATSSAQVFSNPRATGSGVVYQIYMSLELNLSSAPLFD